MTTITWELPIKTVSEANSSEHWTKKAKRHRVQQFFVRLAFNGIKSQPNLPCGVKMTTLGGRRRDWDNNVSAWKYIRDEISECLIPEKAKTYINKKGQARAIKGRADDDPRIKWEYAQEKARKLGIRIEITYEDHYNQLAIGGAKEMSVDVGNANRCSPCP